MRQMITVTLSVIADVSSKTTAIVLHPRTVVLVERPVDTRDVPHLIHLSAPMFTSALPVIVLAHLRHSDLESDQILTDPNRRPVGYLVRDGHGEQLPIRVVALAALVRLREEIEVREDRLNDTVVGRIDMRAQRS